MQKFRKTIRSLNSRLDYIDYHDFEFRVNYKEERQLNKENRLLSNILNSWVDSRKRFV